MNESGGSSYGSVGASVARSAKKVVRAAKTSRTVTRASNRVKSSARRAVNNTNTSRGRAQPVRHKSSSGGSSHRTVSHKSSGGGGGGSSSRGRSVPVVKPKPAPKPPSLASYLGTDSVYQQSVRGGKRSLTDFLSELGRRRGEAGTQFTQTQASMERDRTQQLSDLRDEFASRGLIQSGLYGEEQGRFQQQFTEQGNALKQQQTALLNDLLGQEKNYRRENDLATEQAKQEAIMRRAQKYKLG